MKNRLTKLLFGLLLVLASSGLTYALTQGDFPDVDRSQWYADSVYKARDAGWMNGYSNGNFGQGNPVLREELATILNRYDEGITSKLESQTANFTAVLCDLGKKVELYEHPSTKQILYGVGDFSSGIVENTFLYNVKGERVGSIVRSDVLGAGDSCQLNGKRICATFKEVICKGREGFGS